ncbi:MAG: hypothetical protein ACLRWP_19075 [Bilophila wadsworthia]
MADVGEELAFRRGGGVGGFLGELGSLMAWVARALVDAVLSSTLDCSSMARLSRSSFSAQSYLAAPD